MTIVSNQDTPQHPAALPNATTSSAASRQSPGTSSRHHQHLFNQNPAPSSAERDRDRDRDRARRMNGLPHPAVNGTSAPMQQPQSYSARLNEANLGAPNATVPMRPRSPMTLGQRSATHTGHEPQDKRPSTAPGDDQGNPTAAGFSDHRDADVEAGRAKRPPRPLVLRTRSEFGIRTSDPEESEGEIQRWGTRHGFEEHYESQQFMDKLANVGLVTLFFAPVLCPSQAPALLCLDLQAGHPLHSWLMSS